jgi:hypothetical protein
MADLLAEAKIFKEIAGIVFVRRRRAHAMLLRRD